MSENIEITSSPPTVALIDEGLKFEFTCNRSWSKIKAALYIIFSTTQANYENKYFQIILPGRTLTFYFKAAPNQTGYQLEDWTTGTIADFINQVIAELQLIKYINDDYVLSRLTSPDRLKLEAKEYGPGYDLELGLTNITGFSEESTTAGTNGTYPDDYGIYVAPCLSADGINDAVAKGEDMVPIDSANEAEADVAEYMKDQLESSFNYPTGDNTSFYMQNGCLRYFIRYAEFEDGQLSKIRNNYASDARYVINGGLRQLDSDFLKLNAIEWWNYDEAEEKFLTWAPLNRVTFPGTTERLFYLLTASTAVKLFAQVTTAESGEKAAVEIEEIKAAPYEIIEIPCGVADLWSSETETITSYKVWLEDLVSVKISEERVFTVDNSTYLNKRTFFFKNSFGVYDTINCVGDMLVTDKLKREEIQILKGGVFRREYSLTENIPQWKISTGWLTDLETRKWLADLLLTDDAFLAIGDMVLPILITQKNALQQKDREYMRELTFSFEPDYRNQRYSSIATPDGGDYVLVDEDWQILMDENGYTLIDVP